MSALAIGSVRYVRAARQNEIQASGDRHLLADPYAQRNRRPERHQIPLKHIARTVIAFALGVATAAAIAAADSSTSPAVLPNALAPCKASP